MRNRWLAVGGLGLLIGGLGVGLASVVPRATSPEPVAQVHGATGLYRLARRDLTSQSQVSATLGWAGVYSVVDQAQGPVTMLVTPGVVVSEGQALYAVSGAPVVLLYGQVPAYRTLAPGLTGPDVAALDTDLVALGDATAADLPPGADTFTFWTSVGVERLQSALGEAPTGDLTLGQAVFLPGAVRVTTVAVPLGGSAPDGQVIMQGTSTSRVVMIPLAASDQSEVAVGDRVTITLPTGATTPGVISSVGTVASVPSGPGTGSSGPTITVSVTPGDPAATGSWDEAPVNVTITTGSVGHALVVPVDALMAQPGGHYAVEELGVHGQHHLVRVDLGLFDDADGMVQVSGAGLSVGQRVVVPKL